MKPNTRNWKAWLDQEPPGLSVLHVVGEVEVASASEEPLLAKADAQGPNPSILILDLEAHDSGDAGSQATTWRKAHYQEQRVARGQYSQIDIRWEQEILASIEKVDETI